MTFIQPKLKYAYNALEPYLSEREVTIHFDKHTAKYFDTANKLVKGTVFEKKDKLEDLLSKDGLMKADTTLYNNACQAWNHSFYWSCLTPHDKSGKPSELLMKELETSFGTFDAFKQQFSEKSNDHFASGWAWLVFYHGSLVIKTTPNAGTPLTTPGMIPLLCFDLWEHSHAYQEEYVANRSAYITALWNIIDWEFVSENYKTAKQHG